MEYRLSSLMGDFFMLQEGGWVAKSSNIFSLKFLMASCVFCRLSCRSIIESQCLFVMNVVRGFENGISIKLTISLDDYLWYLVLG